MKQVRDLTLWVGSWTVLPTENSVRKTIHQIASKYRRGRGGKEDTGTQFPGGFSGESRTQSQGKTQYGTDELVHAAEDLESTEKSEAEVAARRGDRLAEDAHYRQYLLMKEIRKVMPHLNESPPRKYTYEEWSRFLELIGEEVKLAKKETSPSEGEDLMRSTSNGSTRKRKPWSWLSSKSPLMSNKSEAEWVLEKLVITAEKQLKRQKEERDREKEKRSG